MSDRRVVEKIKEFIREYTVACSFKNVAENFLWAFVGVYGSNLDSKRGPLWEEIVGVHNWCELPWCIGGEFKVIRFPSEF